MLLGSPPCVKHTRYLYCVPGIIGANRIRVTAVRVIHFLISRWKYIFFFPYICVPGTFFVRVTFCFQFCRASPRGGVICIQAWFVFCILSMLPVAWANVNVDDAAFLHVGVNILMGTLLTTVQGCA